ncbi:MAG: proline dehydrogenase family protein [Gemmatimonadota bacterium]|nr:proline dehydrogenase family protein [Gemmatimonadota bacterium]MDH5760196.1 proline dehydrogenase family protein [Gemmatimonadota bacterium]
MRNVLLWASTNSFMARRLPRFRFVQRATRRFMPGEELQDALGEALRLEDHGIVTTVTLLGENVSTDAEADAVMDHYLGVLDAVRAQRLDTEISVKLTQLGLDQGREGPVERLSHLARKCGETGIVWIDIESSPYVDATLEVFRAVKAKYDNVGLCLQAYLFRTADDLEALLPLRPAIRLVKGAYMEPPEVAFPAKSDVDANFVRLTETLLRARKDGRAGRPVIASHDPAMVSEARRIADEIGIDPTSWEFAMLYGIQPVEQKRLAAGGYGMRVLISYGRHWFPWYMRRLAERPANVWFVVKQMFRR